MRALVFIVMAFFVTWLPNIVTLMIHTLSRNLYNLCSDSLNYVAEYHTATA